MVPLVVGDPPQPFGKCFARSSIENGASKYRDRGQNSVNPDEVAHNEPPHLDLRCLQIYLHFAFDVGWLVSRKKIPYAMCKNGRLISACTSRC